MNKIIIVLLALLAFASCNQDQANTAISTHDENHKVAAVASDDSAQVKFDKEIYDFGVITQGEKVTYAFTFTNTGKSPLIITDATATCGCTVPDYPKTPVLPGESGKIKVVFDSTGKLGMQDKQITLVSNANPEPAKLHLVGEIKDKK